MASDAYEILSLAMRYVFVLLLFLIVLRSYKWLLKDHRAHKKEMRLLPDAGLVGEIVCLSSGKAYPLPREGTIGAARSCDICIKNEGLSRLHATLRFVDGKGLQVVPHKGSHVILDEEPVIGQAYALHGSTMYLADCALRVRLFAGLNVPRFAAYAENPQEEEGQEDAFAPEEEPLLPQDDPQMTWNYAPYPPELLRDLSAPFEDAQEQEAPPFDQFSDPRYDQQERGRDE